MKKRLLAVQGPIQFVAAYIVMEWYRHQKGNDSDCETVLLMYDFLMPSNLEQEFVGVITQLASIASWKNIVFISSEDMKSLMSGAYGGRLARLRGLLKESSFDEIYLSRDFSSPGSPLILNAYPAATRITYGDSFGVVGNYLAPRIGFRPFLSWCKGLLGELLNGKPKKLPFDIAALILPIDLSGTYLRNMRLMVPEKGFVLSIFHEICARLDQFNQYCDRLMAKAASERRYLILLSNLTRSGFMSAENEVLLYLEIIQTNVPPGSSIFLKAHPRGASDILRGVVERLKDNYDVVIIDEPKFARLPIELWEKLTSNCTTLPIFSTSAINMKYLSGKEVQLSLTDNLIDKYFYKSQISRMKKANRAINSGVAAVDQWDSTSLLWRP